MGRGRSVAVGSVLAVTSAGRASTKRVEVVVRVVSVPPIGRTTLRLHAVERAERSGPRVAKHGKGPGYIAAVVVIGEMGHVYHADGRPCQVSEATTSRINGEAAAEIAVIAIRLRAAVVGQVRPTAFRPAIVGHLWCRQPEALSGLV